MTKTRAAFAAACLLLIGIPAARAADAAECSPAVVEHKTFDPDHLPTPPPPLEKGEQAVCVAASRVNATYQTETLYRKKSPAGETYEAAVKMSAISIQTTLRITLWLPKNAGPTLKEHEEGHRQIYQRVYANAKTAAEAIAKSCSGKICIATGKSPDQAEANAKLQAQRAITDDYNTQVCAVWKRVNDIYDDLTAHGVKSSPQNNNPVKVPDAVEAAFKQYAAESEKAAAATQP